MTNYEMTFGEMNQWTQRLNQIMGASITLRDKRLDQMIEDICDVYGYECDCQYVADLFNTVWEARYGVRIA